MTNINEEISDRKKHLINIIKGIGIALFITIVTIFIFSLILTYTKIPESAIAIVVTIIAGISILLGSCLSTLHIRKSGLINGCAIGLIYILILYILSSILGSGFSLNTNSLIMIIISILTGAIGGIMGVNFKR